MRALVYEVYTKRLGKYETKSYDTAKKIQAENPGSEIKTKLVNVKGL